MLFSTIPPSYIYDYPTVPMRQPHFFIFGFPVRIEITAIFLAAFFALEIGRDSIYLLVAYFCSILLHELGHGFAFRRYGCSAAISIHGLGGYVTSLDAKRLTDRQHVIVSLAGPITQLVLLGAPSAALSYFHGPYGDIGWILRIMVFMNIGWAIVNLLPLFPLDGGQALYHFLRLRSSPDPWKVTRIASVSVGVPAIVLAFQMGYPIGALMIGYMLFTTLAGQEPRALAGYHAQPTTKAERPSRDSDILAAEAYACLVAGNHRRLDVLVDELGRAQNRDHLTELKQWQFLIDNDRPASPDTGSPLLLATAALAAEVTPASLLAITQELERLTHSPELLASTYYLHKNGHLTTALSTVSDQAMGDIRDALVAGGLPQEQITVSRAIRIRDEKNNR